MAQTTNLNVDDNDNGAEYTVTLNEIINALMSSHAGNTAPTVTTPHMTWLDTSTTPPTTRRRNAGNNAWINLGQYDGDVFTMYAIAGSILAMTTVIGTTVYGDTVYNKDTGGTNRRVPRFFIQPTDPGSLSENGDIWLKG